MIDSAARTNSERLGKRSGNNNFGCFRRASPALLRDSHVRRDRINRAVG